MHAERDIVVPITSVCACVAYVHLFIAGIVFRRISEWTYFEFISKTVRDRPIRHANGKSWVADRSVWIFVTLSDLERRDGKGRTLSEFLSRPSYAQARSHDCQNEEADRSSAPPLPSPTFPSPPFPSPPLPTFPSPPFPSPPLSLEVYPLKSSYGVWGKAVSSPSGVWDGWSPSRHRFWCILALKSDIWWQQF